MLAGQLFHPRFVDEPAVLHSTLELHQHQDGGVKSYLKFAHILEAWAAIPGVFASHPWCGKITVYDAGTRARYDIERIEG
jgi:hypothetical protein